MEKRSYFYYEKRSGSKYNRRCIDGKTVGCSKCVGYCTFKEHSGFLTNVLRQKHDCIGKDCDYYIAKEKRERVMPEKRKDLSATLLDTANSLIEDLEGMRFMRATEKGTLGWVLHYITISNAYPIDTLAQRISQASGLSIRIEKLNYTFETCAAILLAG